MTKERLLVCSDLDRTLLPNGLQEESPAARPYLHRLAARDEVTLAYVTGRHLGLLQQAIEEYDLPAPDFAVTDVGTSIYHHQQGDWLLWRNWREKIAHDWKQRRNRDLRPLFADMDELALQGEEHQNDYKLSYFALPDLVDSGVLLEVRRRLRDSGIDFELVWSVDETTNTGMIDILPVTATKLGAVRFLMQELNLGNRHTVFAGDSGNDLTVLTSDIPAVLVANAIADVREQAVRESAARNLANALYCAQGGLFDMNGNYAAGVLEGVVHFHPVVREWLAG